jgi:hypothetical protein
MILHTRRLGIFAFEDGSQLKVLPADQLDPLTLVNFLVTTGLNCLLFQRGALALHASVVVIDGEAIAFVGASGWGKSTLATAMEMRGHLLIADDTLAVDLNNPTMPLALPAFPQMKLFPDSLESVGISIEHLAHVTPAELKLAHTINAHFVTQPTPLKRLYVLHTAEQNHLTTLTPGEAFPEIMTHSFAGKMSLHFGMDFLRACGQSEQQLQQCTRLLSSVPVYRLERRWDLSQMDELAALIEQHVYQPQQA